MRDPQVAAFLHTLARIARRIASEPIYRDGNKREPLPTPTQEQLDVLAAYGNSGVATEAEAERVLERLQEEQGCPTASEEDWR